jgi:hypothetical protein
MSSICTSLKNPIFITVRRDGVTREEIIRHIWLETLPEGETAPDTACRREFLGRLDLSNWGDPAEVATQLERLDIEEGIRAAYADARHHADSYLKAFAQRATDEGIDPLKYEIDGAVEAQIQLDTSKEGLWLRLAPSPNADSGKAPTS